MRWYLCCGLLIAALTAGAQATDAALLPHLSYGVFHSAGDLADRYGNGFAIGGGLDLTRPQSRWQFGVMAQFGFGNTVREDVLAGLRTDAGFIIGNQRQPAQVSLRQRQWFIGPRAGYTLPLGDNPRAGLQLTTGLGYFFSHIRIQDDPVQFVPQLDTPYRAGYDRLAGGPALYQFVGYQRLVPGSGLNFYAGAELTAARTRQLRNFDVPDNGPPPSNSRLDAVLGLRAGIIIPIYRGEGRNIYY
ncbi:hypothetical protein [Lewinella sp. IMCC34183]|uniref:hypothetical protein n=1 Tax=Lewinella sp. IMCC34183 TaxID=2248762 RepID=UPI000E243C86|nr:hypothetical protein [Lewinella sp. IMCC34183]